MVWEEMGSSVRRDFHPLESNMRFSLTHHQSLLFQPFPTRRHVSTCFRIGSKFSRSTPTEMQSISENDFECFAWTGVNAPGTVFPNSGPREYWIPQKPTYGPSGSLWSNFQIAHHSASVGRPTSSKAHSMGYSALRRHSKLASRGMRRTRQGCDHPKSGCGSGFS